MRFASELIARFATSSLRSLGAETPWNLTSSSVDAIGRLLTEIDGDYRCDDAVAVHHSAAVEPGARIKGPAIIGPRCFIASNALVRNGCWLEQDCIVGPGCELKSSFLFAGSKLAHFNFVGDSILGADVNLEAGAIIANYRNELGGVEIRFVYDGELTSTGVVKFGALIGDKCLIGANAVIAPGAILAPLTVVNRLALVDHGLGWIAGRGSLNQS